MTRKPCPCRYCADKTVGCHGTCKEYNGYAVERRKENEWTKQQKPPTLSPTSFINAGPRHRKPRRT